MSVLVELLNEKIAAEIEKRYRAENEAARLRVELASAESRLRSLESSSAKREAIVQAQGALIASRHGEDPTWERRQQALEGENARLWRVAMCAQDLIDCADHDSPSCPDVRLSLIAALRSANETPASPSGSDR